jgi:hypothetical protein
VRGEFRRFGGFVLMSICLCSLLAASLPVSAVERTNDDFFVYDLETELMGVRAVGEIRYEFVGTSTYTVGGTVYPVNVMHVSGNLTGGAQMVEFLTANIGGTVLETGSGAAIVREELAFYANFTFGTGQFALVSTVLEQVNFTFSPPILSQFDPSSTAPGDQWSETVSVASTNATWLNGALWGDPVTSNLTVEYSIEVASALEEVETEAGTIECLKISATNESGDSMEYWWSSKVGNFVRVYTYAEGETVPWQSLQLTDYRHQSPTDILLVVAVGAAVLVASIVLMAFVLMKMRRKPPERDPYQLVVEPGPPMDR